ncbi:hypothetical protein DV737_g2583, partial [Chaetothyriales sp. CBS 132003]
MGSVSADDVILKDAPTIPDADSVVPKIEPGQENYDSPSVSSPDQDNDGETVPEKSSDDPPPPPPKRKGGRKPIYASSEERKQRNRQAQAAFRERRTEYIKQLETTIQHHEEQLQSLQQSHRQAADECLMLRYKNSLLERILLEKGIDVQAELALKGSPHLQPARGPSIRSQASSIQKAMMNQQEYNAPVDMIDDVDAEDVDTDSFIPNFRLPPSTSTGGQAMQASPPMTTSTGSDSVGGFQGIDPFDPMLDADPFGLTASNSSDQDSDREPDPPTQAVDKPAARHGKRDAPKEAPTEPASGTRGRGHGGNRSGGFTGNEAAFRDRANRRFHNREQPTTEAQDGARPVRRGGRGDRGPRRGGDRHSRTGIGEHPKQEGHGWGEPTGNGEWVDEKAGEAIAAADNKEATAERAWDSERNETFNEGGDPATIPADGQAIQEEAPAEEEDKSKSYADYMAEQAQKRLEGLGLKEARAPNEGAKASKKWSAAKELTKDDEENYFKGEDKARRERDRTQKKEFLDIDYSFKEVAREGRGGRGGRGRGRGDFGGDRGDIRGRGRGRGRGGERGGFRGEGRGGRGRSDGAPTSGLAVNDDAAFPTLGGK